MDEVLEFFDGRDKFSEPSAVSFYDVERDGWGIRVEVTDRGAAADANRFSVVAYVPDIPEEERIVNQYAYTVGNPDSTITDALFNAHWIVFENLK
ncbi:hypothetical protein [Curtobacterium sp. VKM Ac-2922]|uniref:hypothetical protein n=1 Tax=Curtobacterium sp. VKM Ac-2922 TaxID=2929475 RepID=UPI001FB31B6C|nr:hypothetical protein [Curtobacterium sp. VKM Ac-2922]MCJ1715112.1 hypothetical protein [Curtobacterium sp. VKM Ac-2922]